MEYRPLGTTGIKVSLITLGTMTWGEQNSETDAHQQIELALDHGVNLIDIAEMYPVPPRPETQGETERIVGSWLRSAPGNRQRALIATKAAGPIHDPQRPSHIRGGRNHFDKASLAEALDGSLQRLGTDYVDLYQLHWPDRRTNFFGQLGYRWDDAPDDSVPIVETLAALKDFIDAGKIRYIGLSNETPWGLSRFLAAAERLGLPRVVSIQNPYSLLNRSFEVGLAEFSQREQVGLLAYSPLGMGVLSGKYLNGARPDGARLTLFDRFIRYSNPQAQAATAEYVALAQHHGLSPVQLALAYVNSRPFVTANIVGATSVAQLQENLDSIQLTLSDEILAQIEAIHARWPNPAP
ncbi:NADP(H)-dependent aldo-keto reductase [Neisseriaceae bacterium JH1-16]|nr:NADP(H)-dependent aldo-keto reductase [Neisseriaceae bacterium JH1-16]